MQAGDEHPAGASPMRQALDRLAQRAWSNRKGLPEPALDRSISSPMLSPRMHPQALLDPQSPAVIPNGAVRNLTPAVHSIGRPDGPAAASHRQARATDSGMNSATSKDMTGMGALSS